MRASEFLLSTLKETPSDAEVASHQLMLRAGLIRRVAAGIYNWMPLGLRVLRKVEQVVREEMERAGALELSMPVVQPGELWGRIWPLGALRTRAVSTGGPPPAPVLSRAHPRRGHHPDRQKRDQEL